MRKLKQSFIIAFIILQLLSKAFAQDVGFSQFYDQPLLRNPALAGIFTGDVRFTASYRNQWQSVTVPYRTFGLSSEIKFPLHAMDDNITVTGGLQLLRDIAGTSEFSVLQIIPALNVSVRVGENSFISGGFMGGLMQHRFDPSKLVLGDQFLFQSNGSFTILPYSNQIFNNTSINYFDLSAGTSFSSSFNENSDYYIGVGLFHIATKPKHGFISNNELMLNKKLAVNAGLSYSITDGSDLIFYGDYFRQYNNNFEYVGLNSLQTGIMLKHYLSNSSENDYAITGGILYRWDDAVIPVLQLQLSKFVIGASYDVNVSKLSTASEYRGGFEITLSYKDIFTSRNPEIRATRCPGFGRRAKL
jgi:type IX secretion system PorP/SprF family membrane protein